MLQPADRRPPYELTLPAGPELAQASDLVTTNALPPAKAAAFVRETFRDMHTVVCDDPPLDVTALRVRFDMLDDPAFMHAVRVAATANDTYDLHHEARRFLSCLRRRHAGWVSDADLTKTITVGGGIALTIASVGAIAAGPFACVAIIGAGVYAGIRGYFAVRRLEAEREEYRAMKALLESFVGVLEHD